MEYRTLGRTGIRVSTVGFGTAQLRRVPERQAIDTLLKGFDLGVNIVHTAPDYEGAEDLVAAAVARSDRRVIVASNGYDVRGNRTGRVRLFERLFESTCRKLRTDRLDLFGIASVDDREAFGENVWGRHGMVEFLQRMKARGRLGATFCTTHGRPEFTRRLIESGAFDAVMVAYNDLGFHALTLNPPANWHFEDVRRTRDELFPLCRERGVGVMVMLPLAGGLLCRSKAFPPADADVGADVEPRVSAADALRSILAREGLSCVLPGTCSVAEAEENARAGHAPAAAVEPAAAAALGRRLHVLQSRLCSRCGHCEPLCSKGLPVSWLFRAAHMHLYPASPYETWEDVEYFRLHPDLAAACASCTNVTCACPAGIDIPAALGAVHAKMLDGMRRGLVPPPISLRPPPAGAGRFAARVVRCELPAELRPGQTIVARLFVANEGTVSWIPRRRFARPDQPPVRLHVLLDGRHASSVRLRQTVHPGERGHFVFELCIPHGDRPSARLRLELRDGNRWLRGRAGLTLFDAVIPVRCIETENPQVTQRNPPTTAAAATLVAEPAPAAPAPAVGLDYKVRWLAHNLPDHWPQGAVYHVHVRARNEGARPWLAAEPAGRCVDLVVRANGQILQMVRVPHDVPPGADVAFAFGLNFPINFLRGHDRVELALSFVEQDVAWFEQHGAEPLVVSVAAGPMEQSATADAMLVARIGGTAYYQPSGGVGRGRDGRPYPLVVKEAFGCRIRDPDGNEWIDYVMGWGSALLGYSRPEIRDAIVAQVNSGGGAVVSLPHVREVEVTQLLGETVPCAEMALFGKNGSDVCTAAVRLARAYTGRPIILFSGYNGWQEPFAEVFEPGLAPAGRAATAVRFPANDLAAAVALLEQHAGRVAAVIVEPAAQVEGVDGPVRSADPLFLRGLADACRAHGALLVFDEILTGFRHPGGSVQKSTGVVPDLACFGKALSSGMPLSGLLGRRELFAAAGARIFYHPTFKGEAYSFAAAAAALRVYATEDVPGYVHAFGTRLMAAIDGAAESAGVEGRMVGQPYRMVFRFDDPDDRRRTLKRTLLQQELLKRGILCFRGFMLPSTAHGDAELEATRDAFASALMKVAEVEAAGAFEQHLEIPLVI